MEAKTKSLVAFAHVTNVERSIKFYADLGFKVINSIVPDGETNPSWAWLQSEQANLMLGVASAPIDSSQQAILFYLYFDDIKQTHNIMAELGHKPGTINYPFYMADGEFRLEDPDGYVLMLAQS
ncbi:MAG: VOC family protein [Gammaproteobacteria bacterium]|nr:VOC family protein [Gammaproteobacteria bacterium]